MEDATPTGRRPLNQCAVCGQDFGSVNLFDRHRVGVHAYVFAEGLRMDPLREDGRRCLAVEEMEARGWTVNQHGRWIDPARNGLSRMSPTASRARRAAPLASDLAEARRAA